MKLRFEINGICPVITPNLQKICSIFKLMYIKQYFTLVFTEISYAQVKFWTSSVAAITVCFVSTCLVLLVLHRMYMWVNPMDSLFHNTISL